MAKEEPKTDPVEEPKTDPQAEPKTEPKTEPKVETHTVNVDGEDRQFTLEELKTHTSKVAAADKRFRDSAEATKQAERGLRIEALVKSVTTGDDVSEADVRELAGLLEVDPAEFLRDLQEESPKPDPKAGVGDFSAQFQKEFGATPAEVRAILEHSQSRHVDDARKEIREITDKAVDKDEIIGKMIVGEDSKEVLSEVKNMVAEDVLDKIKDGKPFGAELVTATVQRVRSQLTKLGIPKKLNQQPIVLGLTPSEDTHEDNLVQRYLQKAVKAARKMK
jgi:hypothetical protein